MSKWSFMARKTQKLFSESTPHVSLNVKTTGSFMESLSRDSKRNIQDKLNELSDVLYSLSVRHDKELELIETPQASTEDNISPLTSEDINPGKKPKK